MLLLLLQGRVFGLSPLEKLSPLGSQLIVGCLLQSNELREEDAHLVFLLLPKELQLSLQCLGAVRHSFLKFFNAPCLVSMSNTELVILRIFISCWVMISRSTLDHLMLFVVFEDQLPPASTSLNCSFNHHTEVIDWFLKFLDLIIKLILLDCACSLECKTDVFWNNSKLVDVRSFEVGETCKVFGKRWIVLTCLLYAVDEGEDLNCEGVETLLKSLKVLFAC